MQSHIEGTDRFDPILAVTRYIVVSLSITFRHFPRKIRHDGREAGFVRLLEKGARLVGIKLQPVSGVMIPEGNIDVFDRSRMWYRLKMFGQLMAFEMIRPVVVFMMDRWYGLSVFPIGLWPFPRGGYPRYSQKP